MLDSIKRFFKIYPIPIFVLLLVFIIYYSVFEILRKQEIVSTQPITEAESMQNEFVAPLQPQQNTQTQKNENHIPQKPIPAKQETSTQNTKTYITTKVRALNIRQEPNTTSPIIGKLTSNMQAVILEDNGEWLLIGATQNNNTLGWVLKNYTKILPKTPIIHDMEEITLDIHIPQYYTSKVPRLNIRQEPNTTSNVLGTLTPDDSIEILETKGDWVRFQDINPSSQKNGWVMRRFLKEI